MPKTIELTFELKVDKVSCPGVWLCQDGMVSLSIFALGSSYQTSMVPPIFPLLFKEVFYFRRRFQENCTLSNIFHLLKDETIYCELVKWSSECGKDKCEVLAQYLGELNNVLFPPNLCCTDGVDLLMRRSKKFPGILAPKIEISTKVRIDEVFDDTADSLPAKQPTLRPCLCKPERDEPKRMKPVCHTSVYHKYSHRRPQKSCCSLATESSKERDSDPRLKSRSRSRSGSSVSPKRPDRNQHQYHVYNVKVPAMETCWAAAQNNFNENFSSDESDVDLNPALSKQSVNKTSDSALQRPFLESQFIPDEHTCHHNTKDKPKLNSRVKLNHPCTCDICQRYHELFHSHPLVRSNKTQDILNLSR